jgi:hypothetical protein
LREMLAAYGATLGSSIPWRLSGLLSGYLPTDTRPQARAKLGKLEIRLLISLRNNFFRLGTNFPDVCLQIRSRRAPPMNKHERTLRFLKDA